MTLSSNAPNKNYLTRKTSTVHCPHLNQIYMVASWWLSHLLNIYLRGGRRFPSPTNGYSDGDRSISTISLLKDRDCEQSNKNLDKCWTQVFRSAFLKAKTCVTIPFFSFSLVDGIVNVSIRNLFGYLVFCIVFFKLFVNFLQCFCFVFTIQKWEINNSY